MYLPLHAFSCFCVLYVMLVHVSSCMSIFCTSTTYFPFLVTTESLLGVGVRTARTPHQKISLRYHWVSTWSWCVYTHTTPEIFSTSRWCKHEDSCTYECLMSTPTPYSYSPPQPPLYMIWFIHNWSHHERGTSVNGWSLLNTLWESFWALSSHAKTWSLLHLS